MGFFGSRRRRQKGGNDDGTGSNLDLDSNAWWADREELSRAFGAPQPAPAPEPVAAASRTGSGGSATSRDGRVDSVDYDAQNKSGRGTTNADPKKQTFVFPEGHDPFGTLDLEQGVEWDDVAEAHRRLVKKNHPDRFGTASRSTQADAERRMSEINAAFQELESLYKR